MTLDVAGLYAAGFLSAVLLLSGVGKLASGAQAAGALGQLGLLPPRLRAPMVIALAALEVGVAAAIGLGSRPIAAIGAAGALVLLAGFNALAVLAIRRGKTGIDCGCLGPLARSTFGWGLVARNTALATLAVLVLALPWFTLSLPYPLLGGDRLVPVLLLVLALFPVRWLAGALVRDRARYAAPDRPAHGHHVHHADHHDPRPGVEPVVPIRLPR